MKVNEQYEVPSEGENSIADTMMPSNWGAGCMLIMLLGIGVAGEHSRRCRAQSYNKCHKHYLISDYLITNVNKY